MPDNGADGRVVFSYEGDTSGIDKANNEASQKVKNAGKQIQDDAKNVANKAGKSAEESASKSGNVMTGIVQGIGQAFGGLAIKAGGALVDFGKQGVELASDLNEVQNVVDTTFGANSKAIDKFAQGTAKQFGLSQLQTKQYSSTLGAMFKSMGESSSATLQMSEGLTGLSGDMASFYNLDPAEAFEKLRSGISGETEPLKQLGINMSDANLNAFALSKGMKDGTKNMTQAQLATLRYQYIMNATKDAQGDFAKTSGSYANQQRIMTMNMQQLSTVVGGALLPVLNTVFSQLNNSMPQLQTTLTAIMGPLGQMLTTILPPIMSLIGALVPPLMQLVATILPPITAILKTLLPPLIALIQQILPPIVSILSTLISGPLMQLLNILMPGILALINFLASAMKVAIPIIQWLAAIITDYLTNAFKGITPIINSFIGYLQSIIKFVKDVFAGNWAAVWQDVIDIFRNLFGMLGGFIKLPINGVISMINALIGGLNRIKLPDWAGGYGINIPLIPHLATGGLAYGPTLAVVGDNKNARSDPEVVSPLSKLQSILTASVKNTVAAAPANVTVIVQPTPVNLDGKLIADNTAGHQFASAAIKGMKQ